MYFDLKSRGFDLLSSQWRQADRIERRCWVSQLQSTGLSPPTCGPAEWQMHQNRSWRNIWNRSKVGELCIRKYTGHLMAAPVEAPLLSVPKTAI